MTEIEKASGTRGDESVGRRTAYVLPTEVKDELIAVVGRENALVTDEERDEYRDPYWLPGDRSHDSGLVLFPASTEQVQAIVRIANRHEVPLWVSSQGRNNGYGGPSGAVRGSVLLSLRRMNRVLEVDTVLAYAVVEPGVRWHDLYAVLHEQGDELLVSIPDVGWGSVIGNSLDNGITFMPPGSDFSAPCGLEVVLADGSLLRTGLGAQEGNPSWHIYKRGLGPALDPLFMQSNFGIVTRMGVGLMRRPHTYVPLYLSIPRHAQLAQAVDIVREQRHDGILRGTPGIQDLLLEGDVHFPQHAGRIPPSAAPALSEEELDELADATGAGRWGVRTALWGDRDVLELHERRIRDAWSAIEGGVVTRLGVYHEENWHEIADATFMERLFAGVPSQDVADAIPDFGAHTDISAVVPLRGAEIAAVVERLKHTVISRTGVNFASAIFPINERVAIVAVHLMFNRTVHERASMTYDTVREIIDELAAEGYSTYRAHIDAMDLTQEQLAYGDHAYRRFAEAIKDAIDPKGIIAPGRYGIWPSAYRS